MPPRATPSLLLLVLLVLLAPAARAQTECRDSIFNFTAPFYELAPSAAEQSTRLAVPATHPKKYQVCNSLQGKPSCCSEATLVDFTRWSDALDAYEAVSKYINYYIKSDPRALVDQILLYARAILGNNQKFDWKVLRNSIRNDWGAILKNMVETLAVPTDKIWGAVVTYQEGLLCSACVPQFSPNFLNMQTNSINLQPKAAQDVADSVIGFFNVWDKWFNDPYNSNHLTNAALLTCGVVLKGSPTCRAIIPAAMNFVINAITKNEIKITLCGKPTVAGQENAQCTDMIMNKMMHGLAIDFLPVWGHIFDKLVELCAMAPAKTCAAELSTAKTQLLAFFQSFDERPLVTNVYTDTGFDVYNTACFSHLSGYACGGQGWPLPDHSLTPDGTDNTSTGGGGISVGAVIVVVIVLVSMVGVLAVVAINRHRIRNAAVNMYSRMRDTGEGGSSGPLVGLV